MANRYSGRWFSTFLETMPEEWTRAEVEGIVRRIPLPGYRRVLDISCGPGRHAGPLAAAGYEVTGVDRDVAAVTRAARQVPGGRFLALDQRGLAALRGTFDAAMILWQSFGFFDPVTNDRVLGDIAGRLRPGGRLLLDVYHPGFVRATTGTTSATRSESCRSITNTVTGDRLVSTIAYVDGATETMDFELLEPDDLAGRAARWGFDLVEACCWWDRNRPPTPEEHRYQLVLERGERTRVT
jgi:SAM-dependent methyltransferase